MENDFESWETKIEKITWEVEKDVYVFKLVV